jgi:23S rRNA (cytidine1920-2'-O)/16S rRNA (cytidine1409-2'-O)-methyltransferase
VLEEVLTFAQENGFGVSGLIRSPVLGPKGNVEFLAWLNTIEMHDALSLSEMINLLF